MHKNGLQKINIYYYWDSVNDKVYPPYIELCLQSWERIPNVNNIIHIHYNNISEYTRGKLTKESLENFTLPQRSDAALVGVLTHHYGIFLDADTVLLPQFNPTKYIDQQQAFMYAYPHQNGRYPLLAFLANFSENNLFLQSWFAETLLRIQRENSSLYRQARRIYRNLNGKNVHVKWDYLGAAILNPLINNKDLSEYVHCIDLTKTGFCPNVECADYDKEKYLNYWFEDTETDLNITHTDGIVALQNSWMPDDFKKLNKHELINHPSKIGKLLRYVS